MGEEERLTRELLSARPDTLISGKKSLDALVETSTSQRFQVRLSTLPGRETQAQPMTSMSVANLSGLLAPTSRTETSVSSTERLMIQRCNGTRLHLAKV